MTGEMEGRDNLTAKTKDLERARRSMMEELEAISWYQERIENAKDAELKKILAHNQNEEREHAAMLFNWIMKHDTGQKKAMGH